MKLIRTGQALAFAFAVAGGANGAFAADENHCLEPGDLSPLHAGYDGEDLVRQGSFERDGVRLRDGSTASSFGHIRGRPAIGPTNVIYLNPTNRTKACREAAEAAAEAIEATAAESSDEG